MSQQQQQPVNYFTLQIANTDGFVWNGPSSHGPTYAIEDNDHNRQLIRSLQRSDVTHGSYSDTGYDTDCVERKLEIDFTPMTKEEIVYKQYSDNTFIFLQGRLCGKHIDTVTNKVLKFKDYASHVDLLETEDLLSSLSHDAYSKEFMINAYLEYPNNIVEIKIPVIMIKNAEECRLFRCGILDHSKTADDNDDDMYP